MRGRDGFRRANSGRLWDGGPPPGRPIAVIEATGSARLAMTLTNEGGDVISRNAIVGGGFHVVIQAGLWRSHHIEITDIEDDSKVSIAWIDRCPAVTPVYYWIEDIDTENTPVPQGAFKLVLDTADAGFIWRNPLIGNFTASIPADERVDVLGSRYQASAPNRALWMIRGL